MRTAVLTAALSLLFLLLGSACYVIFNRSTPLAQFLPSVEFELPANGGKAVVVRIMTSYAADFFWATAFPLALQTVLWLKGKAQRWLLCCCFLGVGYEFMQKAGLVAGTFDPLDLLAYAMGTLCSLWIIKLVWRNRT